MGTIEQISETRAVAALFEFHFLSYQQSYQQKVS
jgi:hypothetical protein